MGCTVKEKIYKTKLIALPRNRQGDFFICCDDYINGV